MTLDEQIIEFASLGEVFDPGASEQTIADELADTLMRQPLSGGPLERITRLTRLLRVLKLTTKVVTARRDREAFSANAIFSYQALAGTLGVTRSTMQRWAESGGKAVEAQDVSRETEATTAAEAMVPSV